MAHELLNERVRDIGDGLILGFPVNIATEVAGLDLDTVRLYFFRVSRESRYRQRYTQLGSINSDASSPTSGFGYLGDTGMDSGDDIFRVSNDDWHVYHFGVGTNHPDLFVYHAIDPSQDGNPAIDRSGEAEDIAPGDDRGFYSSKEISDKFDPPMFTERVAIRNKADGQWLKWGFHNDGASQLSGSDTDLYITGRGYKLHPVTSPVVADTMLQMALQRPDEPIVDSILHQVGGINSFSFGTQEPDAWGDTREEHDAFARLVNIDDLGIGGPPEGLPPDDRGEESRAILEQ